MKELIKKELLMNRDLIGIVLVFPLLSYRLLTDELMYLMFSYYSTFFIGVTIIGIVRQGQNIKTEILFLSLPIGRDDLLKSKYLAYGLIGLIFNILLYLISLIVMMFPRFQHIHLGIDVIIISTSITVITLAILIPILYRLKKRYISLTIAFLFLVFITRDILSLYLSNIKNINYGLVCIILLSLAVISYTLSFMISNKSFNRRWVGNERIN